MSRVETATMDIPMPKLSASIPIMGASIAVIMVFSNDCADITDVRISFGTLSEMKPVNIGFLIFSIRYIPINAIIDIIHNSYAKKIPHSIPDTNPASKVIFDMFVLFIAATLDDIFEAYEVIR